MLKDIVLKNRSYRNFDSSTKISKQELMDMVEHARLTGSTMNVQPLKYYLAYEDEKVNKLHKYMHYAKGLGGATLPYKNKEAKAFIIILQDKNISDKLDLFRIDVGIAAQTILLRATEMGYGGCMVGSILANEFSKDMALDEALVPVLAIALGKPDEKVLLVDSDEKGASKAYRGDDDIQYVYKKKLENILL